MKKVKKDLQNTRVHGAPLTERASAYREKQRRKQKKLREKKKEALRHYDDQTVVIAGLQSEITDLKLKLAMPDKTSAMLDRKA